MANFREQKFVNAIERIDFRSERRETYLPIYEDFGQLEILNSNHNQVVFGRRGSGKTHLLGSFEERINKTPNLDHFSVFVDLRDVIKPVPADSESKEAIAFGMFWVTVSYILKAIYVNFREVTKYATALSKIMEVFDLISHRDFSRNPGIFNLNYTARIEDLLQEKQEAGAPLLKETTVREFIESTLDSLNMKYIIILLDEWSNIPRDIQPYLAHMLKNAFFSSKRIAFKISTIRFRTKFMESEFGLELGADIFGEVDLDTQQIWERNLAGSMNFFKNLLYKHIYYVVQLEGEKSLQELLSSSEKLLSDLFASDKAFIELLRAGEGIPRDFLNIFKRSCRLFNQDMQANRISIKHIRQAGLDWYEEDKISHIEKNSEEYQVLSEIIDNAIIKYKSKNFLISAEQSADEVIQSLVDKRLLHRLHQGWSSKDSPGKRFDIFSIDYGSFIKILEAKFAKEVQLELFIGDKETPLQEFNPRDIRRRVFSKKTTEDNK